MASLTSSFARLGLRSASYPSLHLATRAVSTSAPRSKPAPLSTPPAVGDLPIEAVTTAASSSNQPLSTPLKRPPSWVKVPKPKSSVKRKFVSEITRTGRARQLLHLTWLDTQQFEELQSLVAAGTADADLPAWLETEYKSVMSFCEARSKLWVPSSLPEGVEADSAEAWMAQARAELQEQNGPRWAKITPLEVQDDEILKNVWKKMSLQDRENGLIECRFASLRKLGWRTGYSAGYPLPESSITEERKALLAQSKLPGAEGAQGLAALQALDDELAWESWLRLSPAQRIREEAEAWAQRDRSTLFIDTSPSSNIVGRKYARWYDSPQRGGKLVFLPNFRLKLVRNYTPKGKPYDPWKATFRVPLNLHKHALRSFLLSVYGLRTTWVRSMVYRTQLQLRNRMKKMTRTGKGRTWKKVEIGLLEPFVFPVMSERFKKDQLQEDEARVYQSKLGLRRKGVTRWRGGRPVPRSLAPEYLQREFTSKEPLTLEEEEAKLVQAVAAPPPGDGFWPNSRSKGLFSLTTPKGMIPTRRRRHLLKVMSAIKKERQRLIDIKAEELKSVVETAGAGAGQGGEAS